MPIKVTCDSCGRSVNVPEEYVGRRGRCSACGAVIVATMPSIEVSPTPSDIAPPSRKPFRVDPFVATGGGLCALILGAFALYLVIQARQAAHDSRIRELRKEADQLAAAGSTVEAYDRYGQAIDLAKAKEPSDDDARKDAVAASEARDKLSPAVTKILADRKAAADARLAAKQVEEEKERQYNQLKKEIDDSNTEYLTRQATLGKHNANIIGAAFLNRQNNDSQVVRDLEIVLIPRRIPRSKLDKFLADLRSRKISPQSVRLLAGFDKLSPDFMVDMHSAYLMCRESTEGLSAKNQEIQYLAVKGDPLWLAAAMMTRTKSAETGVDGRYRIEGVQGGDYLLYAFFLSEISCVEWCVPISIEKPGEIAVDFKNSNAEIIINRFAKN